MLGYTLHEIAIHHAKKQPGMADSLTEEAPVLGVCRWKAATHDMWNISEKLEDVVGPAFVNPDEALPHMSMSTNLERTDLRMLGGVLEVPSERARMLGGPEKYFSEKQGYILKKAGMDTERQLILRNWLAAAKASANLYDAQGTGRGMYIVAVRFDEHNNIGLYNSKQFDQGRLVRIETPYGGREHYLHGPGNEGRLGYTILYRGQFGWQILDARRTCAGIVNIDDPSKVTAAMIDDMLSNVRAQPGSTFIFCHAKAKTHVLDQYKVQHVQLASADRKAETVIETWNGVRIVTTYNIPAVHDEHFSAGFRED